MKEVITEPSRHNDCNDCWNQNNRKNSYENKAIPRFVTAFASPRIPLPKIAFMRLKMQRGMAAVLPSYWLIRRSLSASISGWLSFPFVNDLWKRMSRNYSEIMTIAKCRDEPIVHSGIAINTKEMTNSNTICCSAYGYYNAYFAVCTMPTLQCQHLMTNEWTFGLSPVRK